MTLSLLTFVAHGQKNVIIDGDKLNLRDSLDGKVILLSSIERGSIHRDALWVTYNRRPGVDPWNKELRELDKNFVKYWTENGVEILGVLITYDDCMCFKTKAGNSPDMYLIHFKLSVSDLTKMKKVYPYFTHDIRTID